MFDWLYWIFGKILYGIDWVLSGGGDPNGFHNTGMCIIFLTIVVYILMYPLNSKSQKSSRMMGKIQPEIKAIQKKYKGKRDQASQMKMNEETQALYAKYGISMFGGCLPLLVTMPVLWCLYKVMMGMGTDSTASYYIESLSYDPKIPAAPGDPGYFLGLDVNVSPLGFFNDHEHHPYGWLAFLVPILAMVLQFINTKMMQAPKQANGETDQMGQSMKMMNYMMPLMSGFFCLSLNMGIGLYWITGSLFRIVQAFFVNRKVDKISLEELIEKNKDKAAKKAAKRAQRTEKMEQYSSMKTSNIKSVSSYQNKATKNDTSDNKTEKDSTDKEVPTTASETKEDNSGKSAKKEYKQGSISGFAHMNVGGKKKD
ncbi:MAG: YidC/Oxa1 family membrane protein insertase [Eubacterium sp.]|nr:YidC/Oxa1 family membrane protein insertase [Eubacterium sp.]